MVAVVAVLGIMAGLTLFAWIGLRRLRFTPTAPWAPDSAVARNAEWYRLSARLSWEQQQRIRAAARHGEPLDDPALRPAMVAYARFVQASNRAFADARWRWAWPLASAASAAVAVLTVVFQHQAVHLVTVEGFFGAVAFALLPILGRRRLRAAERILAAYGVGPDDRRSQPE